MGPLRKFGLSNKALIWYLVLLLLFLPNWASAQQTSTNWWNKEFVIGMYMDPPQKTGVVNWRADTLWDAALEAGFNLATGVQRVHGYYNDPISPMQHAWRRGIRLLYHDTRLLGDVESSISKLDTLLVNPNNHYSGVYVKDEPKEEHLEKVKSILHNFRADSSHLFLVNLYPYYYKGNWQSYEHYVRLFVNDSIPLQVVSFDNYYPHSAFSGNVEGKKYYSNLAYLRRVCGDRPLWSYVLTTEEWLDSVSVDVQAAFLRLSAFAPLAYGCKGILYYTFDTLDDGFIYRDFNYRKEPGWEDFLFYPKVSEEHDVFFGKLSSAGDGRADMAVKTDSDGGTWMVKLASDTTNSWNYVFNEFGRKNYTQPFIADWDCDHRHEFMAFVRDRRLFVSYPLGGWRHIINLQDFPASKTQLVGNHQVAAGCFNNNTIPDFCVAWPIEDKEFLVRMYLDQTENDENDTKVFSTYVDITIDGFVGLAVEADSVLWAVSSSNVCQYARGENEWMINEIEPSFKTILDSCEVRSYWMENDTLCIQETSGIIREYDISNKSVQTNQSHSTSQLHLQAVYNATTDSYDMYGIPQKGVFGFSTLTDANHRTTNRYDMVKANNLYLRETLAPIVMHSRWLGAWHDSIPPNEVDSLIDVLDAHTPLLKNVCGKLLVGMFESNDTLRYLLVVNKSETTLDTCRIVLRGNFMENITMLPRIITGDTTLSVTFRPDSMDTSFAWNNMKGGECIAFSIHPHRPFNHRKIYEDFDGDNRPDVSYLQFDSIQHNVLLNARYSSEAFSVERVLANFPYTLDNEGNRLIWNLSARYGKDSFTDVALFDGNAGVLYIKNRTADSLRVDTTHFYLPQVTNPVPFSGDINGDSLMDFSYRADNDESLRVYLSNNGSLGHDAYSFNKYGNSLSTIPVRGDWDGNGLEDISLYRADRKMLIDYAYHDSHLGLGTWDVIGTLDAVIDMPSFKELQPFCRDWDGDGLGDLGLYCSFSGIFYIDLGYNGWGWDIIVTLPLKSDELLFQVVCDDWDQDGLDDLIYVYRQQGSVSSISVDLGSNGLKVPDQHYDLQH